MNQENQQTDTTDPCQDFMVTEDMIIRKFMHTLEVYGPEKGTEFIEINDMALGDYAGWNVVKRKLEDLLMAYKEEQSKAREREQEAMMKMMVMKMMSEMYAAKPQPPTTDNGEKRQKMRPSEKHIRRCLERLMNEKDSAGNPLFCRASHWQAVFCILAELMGYNTNDFDFFDGLMERVKPDKVNAPYSRSVVKNISQTPFFRPFDEWVFDSETMKKRRPYQRMVDVASRFKELLEAPPDANPLPETLPDV